MTRARVVALAVLVWAFVFFAFAGTTLLAPFPTARIVAAVAFAGPMVAWAALVWRRPVDRLDLAVLAGVAAHLVVSFASRDPTASLEMSAVVAVHACVYGFARWAAARQTLRRMLTVAAVVALLFWLSVLAITWIVEKVAAVQHLGWPPPADPVQGWVWGSVNSAPVLTLLAAPFISWLPAGTARRVAAGIWLVCSFVVVPLSFGRAGWLGIATALVTAGILLGVPRLGRLDAGGRRWLRSAAVAGVALVVGAVAAGAATGGLGILAAALDSRLRLWSQALALFGADPLTGSGPSTFGWARLAFVPDYVDRVAARDVHSVPLQTLADGGLVLGAAALAITVAWLTLVIERWPRVGAAQRVAVAVVAGYAAFALLDDLSFLPSITVLLILVAVWSIPEDRREAERHVSGRRSLVMPVGLLLIGALTVPSLMGINGARLAAFDGRQAAVDGDWPAASNAFERATSMHPTSALLWMSVGLAAARAGDEDVAIAAYERARNLSPGDPRPFGALAALAGSDAEAAELLGSATRRSNDPRYAYRLGSALVRADDDGAARAFAHAVVLWSDWWAVVPEDARDATRAELPEVTRIVGSVGGTEPREGLWNAQLSTDELAPDAGLEWRAVALAANGRPGDAAAVLADAPSTARADLARAAVARAACDRRAYEAVASRLEYRPPPTLPGEHPVLFAPSGIYREPELGDYQPITDRSVPEAPLWPEGTVELRDCGW